MADDSASSKGVSRGGNGAVGNTKSPASKSTSSSTSKSSGPGGPSGPNSAPSGTHSTTTGNGAQTKGSLGPGGPSGPNSAPSGTHVTTTGGGNGAQTKGSNPQSNMRGAGSNYGKGSARPGATTTPPTTGNGAQRAPANPVGNTGNYPSRGSISPGYSGNSGLADTLAAARAIRSTIGTPASNPNYARDNASYDNWRADAGQRALDVAKNGGVGPNPAQPGLAAAQKQRQQQPSYDPLSSVRPTMNTSPDMGRLTPDGKFPGSFTAPQQNLSAGMSFTPPVQQNNTPAGRSPLQSAGPGGPFGPPAYSGMNQPEKNGYGIANMQRDTASAISPLASGAGYTAGNPLDMSRGNMQQTLEGYQQQKQAVHGAINQGAALATPQTSNVASNETTVYKTPDGAVRTPQQQAYVNNMVNQYSQYGGAYNTIAPPGVPGQMPPQNTASNFRAQPAGTPTAPYDTNYIAKVAGSAPVQMTPASDNPTTLGSGYGATTPSNIISQTNDPYVHSFMPMNDPRFTRDPNTFTNRIDEPHLLNQMHVPMSDWGVGGSGKFDPNKLTPQAQKMYRSLEDTALRTGTPIMPFSGNAPRKYKDGHVTGNHPTGNAIDIVVKDPVTGKPVFNSMNPVRDTKFAKPYGAFANSVMDTVYQNPDAYSGVKNSLRWGGNFVGGEVPRDYEHFDVTPGAPVGTQQAMRTAAKNRAKTGNYVADAGSAFGGDTGTRYADVSRGFVPASDTPEPDGGLDYPGADGITGDDIGGVFDNGYTYDGSYGPQLPSSHVPSWQQGTYTGRKPEAASDYSYDGSYGPQLPDDAASDSAVDVSPSQQTPLVDKKGIPYRVAQGALTAAGLVNPLFALGNPLISYDLNRINQMTPEEQAAIKARWASEQEAYRRGEGSGKSNVNEVTRALYGGGNSVSRPYTEGNTTSGDATNAVDAIPTSAVSDLAREYLGPTDPYSYGLGGEYSYYDYG